MSIVRNSLIGFAVGDAIGVPIEFEHREKLLENPVTKMLGYGSYSVPEGVWSDDTSMTLATIDSIIKNNGINYNNMADCFINWIDNADYTATNEVFDVGITTRYALVRYTNNKLDATKCGGESFNENGNGSLMRMLPIALYCYYKNVNDDELYDIVRNCSAITHAHEISIMGCYIYTNYLLSILNGLDKIESYNLLKNIDYQKHFKKESMDVYKELLEDNIQNYRMDKIKSTGYVKDTLETVIWVILNTNSYKQAIIGAINLGGDTDTIGAITGSIAGILYGMEDIPKKWLNKMKRLDYLEMMADDFDKVLVKCK